MYSFTGTRPQYTGQQYTQAVGYNQQQQNTPAHQYGSQQTGYTGTYQQTTTGEILVQMNTFFKRNNLISCQVKPQWQMLYQFDHILLYSTSIPGKMCELCSENKITLKGYGTCNNQFFINFKLK